MNESEIRQIVEKQRAYFYTGATLPLDGRIRALKKLRTYIQEHEAELERGNPEGSWKKCLRKLYV